MLSLLLIELLFNPIYACFEGFREGVHMHNRMLAINADKINMHPWFNAQRGMVLLMEFLYLNQIHSTLVASIICISAALMFPYFHDGMYFTIRHKLRPTLYPKKWTDEKDKSVKDSQGAWFEYSYLERSVLLFTAIVMGAIAVVFPLLFKS